MLTAIRSYERWSFLFHCKIVFDRVSAGRQYYMHMIARPSINKDIKNLKTMWGTLYILYQLDPALVRTIVPGYQVPIPFSGTNADTGFFQGGGAENQWLVNLRKILWPPAPPPEISCVFVNSRVKCEQFSAPPPWPLIWRKKSSQSQIYFW